MTKSALFLPKSCLTFFFVILLSSCTTNHFTNSILLEKNGSNYSAPKEESTGIEYAKNAVFIPSNSKFEIRLSAINPAWIHQGVKRHIDMDSTDANGLTAEEANYIDGKDLWILISVRTTDPSDPLEFSTKQIYKATVVKYNMRSFGVIPLDVNEQTPFSLEGNSSYEVEITVYQVKDIFIKRIAAEFYNNNPGLSGIVKEGWGLLGSTFKSLVGDPIIKVFKKEYGSDLAAERTLLELGAVLEFHGQFSVLRTSDEAVPNQWASQSYILVDRVKAGYGTNGYTPAHVEFSDPSSYRTALVGAEADVKPPLDRYSSFIIFSVANTRSYNVMAKENHMAVINSTPQPAASAADNATAAALRETLEKQLRKFDDTRSENKGVDSHSPSPEPQQPPSGAFDKAPDL